MDLYQVIADGIAWVDPDGIDAWPLTQAGTLADGLERAGYVTAVIGPVARAGEVR